MSIEVRIVSNKWANTTKSRVSAGKEGEYKKDEKKAFVYVDIEGTIDAYDFYTFYTVSPGDSVSTDPNPDIVKRVTMILPIGGPLAGLYRFPRIGEKVLVEMGDQNENYLLGFVPNQRDLKQSISPYTDNDKYLSTTASNISLKVGNPGAHGAATADEVEYLKKEQDKAKLAVAEIDKLLQDQGMILRYRQSGKKEEKIEEADRYSEIGFYHRPTSWKPGTPSDYEEMWNPADDAKPEEGYPKVDHIDIKSTGDINASAVNAHQIKAKRFELLANCPEADHKNKDALAFGDNEGDDSNLYAGDAHIRARNRIIIKAGDEIVLQVGRSLVRISDDGITLSAKKVEGNYNNPWDTVLSLTPRDGISMAGQQLNMAGFYGFSMEDTMGGSISSTAGILRILAKDIKLSTLTTIGYVGKQIGMLNQFWQSVEGVSRGMMNAEVGAVGGYIGKIIDIAVPLVMLGVGIKLGKDSDPEDKDPLALFMTLVGVLTKINAAVCTVVAQFLQTKKDLRDHGTDNMSLAQMVVDFGILETATVLIVAKGVQGLTHSANFHLRSSAHMEMHSLTFKMVNTLKEDASGPLAGYVDKAKEAGVKFAKETWEKLSAKQATAGIIAALVVLGGIGAAVAVPFLIKKGSVEELNKSELDALKEL